MGGLDWAALPMFAALYGVEDHDMLIERLMVLKTHQPDADD